MWIKDTQAPVGFLFACEGSGNHGAVKGANLVSDFNFVPAFLSFLFFPPNSSS